MIKRLTPSATKLTPSKFRYVWAWLGMYEHAQPASVVLHAIFPWLLSLCKNVQDTGPEQILVYNLKLCELNSWKNALIYLEIN